MCLVPGKDLLIASASGDSTVKIWCVTGVNGEDVQDAQDSVEDCRQTIPIKGNGFAMDLRVGLIGENEDIPILFLALDDSKLHIYGYEQGSQEFAKSHKLELLSK